MPDKRVTTSQRQIVAERARDCCEYCQSQARFATQSFSVEHVRPRSQQGETILDNLALACQGCNGHKHTKIEGYDAVTKEVVPLYHPRKDKWAAHFQWNEDYSLIVGISPTGRATVGVLQLNRDGLVNLRRILYQMGEHPPRDPEEKE